MDMQWSLIWKHSNAISTKTKKHYAFDDPLDRSEWEGLGWTVPVVSRLLSGARTAPHPPEKVEPVERFTMKPATKPVCVS